MEPVSPVRAAEPGALYAADLVVAPLGGDGGRVEDRVSVVEGVDDPIFAHGVVPVQRHEQLAAGVDTLETGQTVGQRGHLGSGLDPVVVPTGPGPVIAGEEAFVGVEGGPVRLVAEGAQDLALLAGRVGEHGQRLVAVRGHDHVVEAFDTAPGDDLDTVPAPRHLLDRRRQAHPVAQWPEDGLHVGAASSHHGSPGGLVPRFQEPVVVEEPGERHRRHLEEGGGVGRPDRRAHRGQVPLGELRRPPVCGEEVGDGHREVVGLPEEVPGDAVEASDVAEHPEERRAAQVPPLGEHSGRRRALPFDPGHLVADREAHVAGLGGDA